VEPAQQCCGRLELPGPRVTDIDLDAVRRLVIVERRPPAQAAAELGTTLTHIRFALEHVDPEPPRGPRKAPPVGWQLRERARAVLTRAFFQREYLDGEKTLRHIAEETGIRREIVSEIAKEHGITLIRTRRPFPIGEAWLREQYLTHKRSATDIANELGTEDMTVLRRLHHFGIPVRPTGVHSQTPMILKLGSHIPRDIRKAVEAGLHGWHRLARFQTAMAFPSLVEAGRHIGADPTALTEQFQRLERDIGTQLYHRATPVRGGRHRAPTANPTRNRTPPGPHPARHPPPRPRKGQAGETSPGTNH
jgi:hypothetical protein